jgi:hypothetical protein
LVLQLASCGHLVEHLAKGVPINSIGLELGEDGLVLLWADGLGAAKEHLKLIPKDQSGVKKLILLSLRLLL